MKYIIEISNTPLRGVDGEVLWKAKGFDSLAFTKEDLKKMEPYIDFSVGDQIEIAGLKQRYVVAEIDPAGVQVRLLSPAFGKIWISLSDLYDCGFWKTGFQFDVEKYEALIDAQ